MFSDITCPAPRLETPEPGALVILKNVFSVSPFSGVPDWPRGLVEIAKLHNRVARALVADFNSKIGQLNCVEASFGSRVS
jgi:hypothetical protein